MPAPPAYLFKSVSQGNAARGRLWRGRALDVPVAMSVRARARAAYAACAASRVSLTRARGAQSLLGDYTRSEKQRLELEATVDQSQEQLERCNELARRMPPP